MGRVMELLDARSVARCTAESRAWRGVAAADCLWVPKFAELMVGKAHIPRLTMIRTASKLSTYSMAIMDGKRSRITKEDLCDHAWEYRFTKDGNALRTKFLVEMLKYKDNESKDNIPEDIQELIRRVRI